jgi:hypothetical protein
MAIAAFAASHHLGRDLMKLPTTPRIYGEIRTNQFHIGTTGSNWFYLGSPGGDLYSLGMMAQTPQAI